MNKKKIYGLMALLLVVSVSAVLLEYYGQVKTTINVEQPISVEGELEYTIPETVESGNTVLGDVLKISNDGSNDIDVQITSECKEGETLCADGEITTSYVGQLELTKKNTATWQPEGNPIEITYTVVGDTFEFSEVPEGYTLIYYKDKVVGLKERLANPQPAIIVTSDIGSLPQSDDVNNELENYCQGSDKYDHCNGAKLWVVPTSDLTGNDLNWANMADYYYETDLIRYFNNTEGRITIPAGSYIEFYPEFELASNLEGGTYTITTTIEPVTN